MCLNIKSFHHVDAAAIMIEVRMRDNQVVNRVFIKRHYPPKGFQNPIIFRAVDEHRAAVRKYNKCCIPLPDIKKSNLHFSALLLDLLPFYSRNKPMSNIMPDNPKKPQNNGEQRGNGDLESTHISLMLAHFFYFYL